MTMKRKLVHPLAYATEARGKVDHPGELFISSDYLKSLGGHARFIVSLACALKLVEQDGEHRVVGGHNAVRERIDAS